jgi:hypothetical protein
MGGSRMTPIALISIIAVLLLVLMLRRTGQDEAETRSGAESRLGLPGTQIVRRIFCEEDREFISRMHSRRLQRLYQEERRSVALHWVRRTSLEVGRIMRTHRLNSRQSQDLHVAAEAKLFLQYLRLRFLCGLLLFLIYLFGPHAIQHLAFYAGELYQRIGDALPNAAAARATAQTATTP